MKQPLDHAGGRSCDKIGAQTFNDFSGGEKAASEKSLKEIGIMGDDNALGSDELAADGVVEAAVFFFPRLSC